MIFHLFIVQDSLLLLTRVANYSAGIGLFSTLVENIIPHVNLTIQEYSSGRNEGEIFNMLLAKLSITDNNNLLLSLL